MSGAQNDAAADALRAVIWCSKSAPLTLARASASLSKIGMTSLDQYSQRPRTAADVEHAVTRPNGRLIEEYSPGGIATKQFHEGIVGRQ